jgi:Mrp family chromosome partitioning ATPase
VTATPDRLSTLPDLPAEVISACSAALYRTGGERIALRGVTSAVRSEGRSTVALGLTRVLHDKYARTVLLVELDAARPTLSRSLGLPEAPGITEVVLGQARLDDAIRWLDPRAGVLPAGQGLTDPAALANGIRQQGLLQQLQDLADVVVADLPPMDPTGPGPRVVELIPDLLFVVRAGGASISAVRESIGLFDTPPPVILNRKKSAVPRWLRTIFGG